MANKTAELSVDSGKYSFIMYEGDWRIHVMRYSAPWLIIEKGHNAIHSLLTEAVALKEENERLTKLVSDAQVSITDADKLNDWQIFDQQY